MRLIIVVMAILLALAPAVAKKGKVKEVDPKECEVCMSNLEMIDKLIPQEFYNADIFIYQNYSDKPNSEYDLSNILNNILPASCIKICISFLQFDATFCYNENDKQNIKTKSDDFYNGSPDIASNTKNVIDEVSKMEQIISLQVHILL